MRTNLQQVKKDLRYLTLLATEFPNVQAACTEIINLEAILNLPKGTEHYLSDIHGEDEAFVHIMNNASGSIRIKIDDVYGNTLSAADRRALASLIYYPEIKLEEMHEESKDIDDWYRITLHRLVELCRHCSYKYTRSKVRKALPKGFEYIMDELLFVGHDATAKEQYFESIIESIIEIERSDAFIIALCNLIKRLVVDHLHLVGDIFDRGPHADVILDRLMAHHNVDVQWGNHDVLWMGAAAGSTACIATVLNSSMRYNNLDVLENGYGINLLPLAMFAQNTYDRADIYGPKAAIAAQFDPKDLVLLAKMHKAMSVIQFKLEGQLVRRHPEYKMDHRDMFSRVDLAKGTLMIEGKEYALRDSDFPTIDPADPNRLTPEEQTVIDSLKRSFESSDKLQRHIQFLFARGSLYHRCNDNLLFHGCIPTNPDGSRMEFNFDGVTRCGKDWLDFCDAMARQAYHAAPGEDEQEGRDFLWYLWCGAHSPVFGREYMTTFERLFIEDEATWKEPKDAYYTYSRDNDFCVGVLREFGITGEFSHIINGHIPVKVKDGEGPVKAGGKLIVIDGGFCRAYQKQTGIAGYTMFYNSACIKIVAHEPFTSREDAIANNTDITSTSVIVEEAPHRMTVGGTDNGIRLRVRIDELKNLVTAYRHGLIKESAIK